MVLKEACCAMVGGAKAVSGANSKVSENAVQVIGSIVAVLVTTLILAVVGKWLWNNVVVKLISVAKPADNVWEILGLSLFLGLIKA